MDGATRHAGCQASVARIGGGEREEEHLGSANFGANQPGEEKEIDAHAVLREWRVWSADAIRLDPVTCTAHTVGVGGEFLSVPVFAVAAAQSAELSSVPYTNHIVPLLVISKSEVSSTNPLCYLPHWYKIPPGSCVDCVHFPSTQ